MFTSNQKSSLFSFILIAVMLTFGSLAVAKVLLNEQIEVPDTVVPTPLDDVTLDNIDLHVIAHEPEVGLDQVVVQLHANTQGPATIMLGETELIVTHGVLNERVVLRPDGTGKFASETLTTTIHIGGDVVDETVHVTFRVTYDPIDGLKIQQVNVH